MPNTTMIHRAPGRSKQVNPKRVAQLADAGLSRREVAKTLGIGERTVYRYLTKLDPLSREIKHFKEHRADIYANLAAIQADKRLMVLESLGKEDMAELDARQKAALHRDLAVSMGIDHDHERLERGLSTQNVAYADLTNEAEKVRRRREELQEKIREIGKQLGISHDPAYSTSAGPQTTNAQDDAGPDPQTQGAEEETLRGGQGGPGEEANRSFPPVGTK